MNEFELIGVNELLLGKNTYMYYCQNTIPFKKN